MNRLFPHMTDSPERAQVLGGLAYGVFPFVILPFTLVLFVIGITDTRPFVVLEFLYQAINFLALFTIFRTYLQDSWFTFSLQTGRVLRISFICALAICLCYALGLAAYLHSSRDLTARLLMEALPVTGIELTLMPDQLALYSGIPGVLFLVFLSPVTNACMYYAAAFSPLCANGRPLAAYGAVAALTAVPRIITWCTVWGGQKEAVLYLAQLPVHLFSCWLYQQTNTIWAPIITHAVVNTVCCGLLFGGHFLGLL